MASHEFDETPDHNRSPRWVKGTVIGLSAGLVLALAGDGYLLKRSGDTTEQMAQMQAAMAKLQAQGGPGAAQAQQQVDFIDAGKISGVCSAILLAADTIGLVVRPHRVEKPVDVQLLHQPLVEAYDIAERLLRGIEHDVRHGAGDSEMHDTGERIRRALQRQNSARVLVNEQEFIRQRCKALANAGTRPIVRR